MLPIYFIYLAGASKDGADSMQAMKSGGSRRMLINSIGFVTGFTIVFLLLGMTVTSLGHFLQSNRNLLEKASGLIMIVFGLNFAGILKIGFLNTEKRFSAKTENLKFLSSVLFGMAFGLGWTPCLGAFLGSALLLAGNSKTILQGALLLLVYSLGLGIPFILSSIVFEKMKDAFKWLQKNGRVISILSGMLLIVCGILVFTGVLKYL
jgi:cytochrome c-type biogenesis protein